MNHKLNWDTNYLIPKFLKNFISVNYYKNNFLKEFTIVSILRKYTSVNDNKLTNSIILNKNLIIKPIDTKNLTTTFTKSVEQNNFTENFKVEVYKIVIHINNSFNPTNIGLFDKENKTHFYHMEGDKTLHINLGLLTLFEILTSENVKVEKRVSNAEGEYYIPNSKLSLIIEKLIKLQTVTLYSKDSNNELIWDSEYCLYNDNENPLKFIYDSDLDIYWRYDLKDIPLFIHNIWWDVILILFKLYNIKIWKSADKIESNRNSNNFRLKIIILQLLGGLPKLNMFENVDYFTKKHYVINNSNFDNILKFEKELLKIDDSKDKIKSLEDLLKNVDEQFKLTENITSELKSMIFEGYQETIEYPFDEISTIKNKINENIEISQSDEIRLNVSSLEFTSNYHFNILLIYILALEMIIKITSDLLKKNKKVDYLENIFFTAIANYLDAITFYSKKLFKI